LGRSATEKKLYCNSSYMFRPKYTTIFKPIVELWECTIDNAFSLRDLVYQVLVIIIVVCYIEDLRLQFKRGTL